MKSTTRTFRTPVALTAIALLMGIVLCFTLFGCDKDNQATSDVPPLEENTTTSPSTPGNTNPTVLDTSTHTNITGRTPGLYETGTDTMTKSWNELINEGILKMSDGRVSCANSRKVDLVGDLVLSDRVTSIDTLAFNCCNGLTSVTLSGNVTEMGQCAFSSCSNLANITIPNGVTTIGEEAFALCSNLMSVKIPASVITIGEEAFYGCGNLLSVTLGEGLASISKEAFHSCDKLVEVYNRSTLSIVPGNDNHGNVGQYAKNIFTPSSGESKLYTDADGYIFFIDGDTRYLMGKENSLAATTLTLPTDCNGYPYEVYSCAFSYHTNLETVTFGDNITKIHDEAFFCCTNLATLNFNSILENIGDRAFYHCDELTTVTVPDSVITIGSAAFLGCDNLNNIVLGSGVTTIGTAAFKECTSLARVTIGNNVTNIAGAAFYNCANLTSVEIPASVTTIGQEAFYGCRNLLSVVLGEGLTSIGTDAFYSCDKLVEVYNLSILSIVPGNTNHGNVGQYAKNIFTPSSGESKLYTDTDGYIFFIDGDTRYLMGKENSLAATTLTLPTDCNGYPYEVFSRAFYKHLNLTSVTVSEGVTSIGNDAFRWCKNLTSVTVSDSVASIGDSVFAFCSKLTNVTLNPGIQQVGKASFYRCEELQNITFAGTRAQWEEIASSPDWHYSNDYFNVICTDGQSH